MDQGRRKGALGTVYYAGTKRARQARVTWQADHAAKRLPLRVDETSVPTAQGGTGTKYVVELEGVEGRITTAVENLERYSAPGPAPPRSAEGGPLVEEVLCGGLHEDILDLILSAALAPRGERVAPQRRWNGHNWTGPPSRRSDESKARRVRCNRKRNRAPRTTCSAPLCRPTPPSRP